MKNLARRVEKKKKFPISQFPRTFSLTVVIQSKVAAEFAGAFLSAPDSSSGVSGCEFFPPPPPPVEMLPPGVAETNRPTNERAGEERSCKPAAAVRGIAAEVRERVPSWSTRSIGLGLAATWKKSFLGGSVLGGVGWTGDVR